LHRELRNRRRWRWRWNHQLHHHRHRQGHNDQFHRRQHHPRLHPHRPVVGPTSGEGISPGRHTPSGASVINALRAAQNPAPSSSSATSPNFWLTGTSAASATPTTHSHTVNRGHLRTISTPASTTTLRSYMNT